MSKEPNQPEGQDLSATAVPGSDSRKQVVVIKVGNATLRLDKTRIVVGSVVSADVRLTGQGIAPIHAVIEIAANPTARRAGTIYDLGSDSGVLINGTKGFTAPIKSGDTVKIAHQSFEFHLEDVQEASKASGVRVSGNQKLFVGSSKDLAPLLLESEGEVEEIFDYRPASRSAIEVVMSWKDNILDVEHFVGQRRVTLGASRNCDFGIPPILSSPEFVFVEGSPESYELRLDSRMKGIIQQRGELRKITEVTQAERVQLSKDDFAKISIGDVDFYISTTAAPPKLKRRRLMDRDPFLLKILLLSLLFSGALVTTLLSIRVPQTLEAEEVPERIATILYQPEKFSSLQKLKTPVERSTEKAPPKTPKPQVTKIDIKPKPIDPNKPIPKEIDVGKKQQQTQQAQAPKQQPRPQNQGKEGEGARAKGTEGVRGTKTAKNNAEHQTLAKRPSPLSGKGRGGGDSQVPDIGNVDFLKGAGEKIKDILGNSGERLGKAGNQLQGFGGFDTRGEGGLGLSGQGVGGGGEAAALGGLGKKGHGGGRVGTGLGAAGSGTSLVGGKSRVVLRTGGPEETVIMGSIDASAIEAALLAHRDQFKYCYEKEINAGQPKLAGRVSTSFVIGSSGRVTQAGVASSSLNNSNTERCILDVIRSIDFPIPKGGGIVQVTYPFKFTPVGG